MREMGRSIGFVGALIVCFCIIAYQHSSQGALTERLLRSEARAQEAEFNAAKSFNAAPPPVKVEGALPLKSLEEMRKLQAAVNYNEVIAKSKPFGWFDKEEYTWAYTMGRYCPGPVLEQGPFSGLSTTAIAAGVRDSELKDGHTKMFISADIFPVDFSVDPEIGYPHYWKHRKGDGGLADLYVHGMYEGSAPELGPEREKLLKDGLMISMVGVLNKNNLLKYTHVVVGDRYPELHYPCAFYDTAHSITELIELLPIWVATVKKAGGSPMMMSFHDYAGGPAMRDIIKQVLLVKDAEVFDRTWVIEVHGLQPRYQVVLDHLPSSHEIAAKVFDAADGKDYGTETILATEGVKVCHLIAGALGKSMECAVGMGGPMKGNAIVD